MTIPRRKVLMGSLFGAGYVGLRALATGLPPAVFLRGGRAFAEAPATCFDAAKAQFIIFNTSGQGDPLNANAPGTYADTNIVHPAGVEMAPTQMQLGGRNITAARPWTTLPQAARERMNVWHLMTDTPVHPKEPEVLRLLNATEYNEMLPSLLAKQLSPCLGTLQSQPITVGARTPSEGLSFDGQALPIIPPLALKATLTSPGGPLSNLQALRDQTLTELDELYRSNGASAAHKKYLDSMIASQTQVRGINQDLLNALESITDNGIDAQITAAIAMIKMNVTPVIAIHIPFGGDNHNDNGLANESAQLISGMGALGSLMTQLASAGLADRVTFMSLNVFGRTIGPSTANGRQHNENHQVSIAIGKGFKSALIGGVGPVGRDFGAVAIDSSTGRGGAGGDISPRETLTSFGKTMLAAMGADSAFVENSVTGGKVVTAALAG